MIHKYTLLSEMEENLEQDERPVPCEEKSCRKESHTHKLLMYIEFISDEKNIDKELW
jgi:hypothetical protein